MGDTWYVMRGKEKQGPFTSQVFNQMVADDRLAPTDLVWKEGTAGWIPASSIPGVRQTRQHTTTKLVVRLIGLLVVFPVVTLFTAIIGQLVVFHGERMDPGSFAFLATWGLAVCGGLGAAMSFIEYMLSE